MLKIEIADPRLQRAALEARRWWVYQRERFPLLGHGPLVAVFSLATVGFSQLLRGQAHVPDAGTLLVGFASALLFFLEMRIADEFKDFDDDSRFRAYRPVTRGLVTLRQLGTLGVASMLMQIVLALALSPALIPFLLLVWGYLALMTREFFVPAWLRSRPIAYMLSHMPIIALIALYVSACDWRVAGVSPPAGLVWWLALSYCNGIVIEIGRKIRAPEDEEVGVQTYSAVWGRPAAISAWLGALLLTAACAWLAASQLRFATQAAALLAVPLLGATLTAVAFWRAPAAGRGRRFEHASGIWTLILYLSVGALPLLSRL